MAAETITGVKHPTIVRVRQSLGQAGGGRATAFLVEDAKMVSQALAAGAPLETVLYLDPVEQPEEQALLEAVRRAGAECQVVTRGVFFRVLDLGYETATRVLATVRAEPLPASRLGELTNEEACLLVGEGIQDPRNVGVLIRTADALGVRAAIFTADSADPYSRASVRSTTGSILRVPLVLAESLLDVLDNLRHRGVRIIGTSAHAATACWDADLSPPCALLLGNETTGLSPEAQAACDLLVTIPMQGEASSLNVTVAVGALLYEVARQARGATV
ncbi:MAG: RNA methyltransferase [Armatimonadetes bacterium]|nr:RNA methyltransferase [Armatimonadota bacterium]